MRAVPWRAGRAGRAAARRPIAALALAVAFGCAGATGCAGRPALDRAQELVRKGREAEAEAVLREDLARDPAQVASLRLLVRVQALRGDLPGARASVERLRALVGPGDPAPWLELGHALELQHAYDDALEAYDRAGAEAPRSPAGPLEGGRRAARWGEAAWARPRLEEAVRRGARDAGTLHTLGVVCLALGDVPAAEVAYRGALAADPRDAASVLGLATAALARDDVPAALAAYDALARLAPSRPQAHLGRAYCLARLGRDRPALAALDDASSRGARPADVTRLREAIARGVLAAPRITAPPPPRGDGSGGP